MRNKLPILLALILMIVAAMPWLKLLELQRRSDPTSTMTVPPPEQVVLQAISAGIRAENPAGNTQGLGNSREGAALQPSIPAVESPNSAPGREHGTDLSRENGMPGRGEPQRESQVDARNSANVHVTNPSQSTLPKPQTLLDNAVRTVETRQFISARIKQQGEMFGHQITGEGRYYELRRGPIPRIHLELTAEVGSVSTSLVQVCNGATFWSYRKLPSGESLSKLDAVRAITALEHAAGKLPREALSSSPGLGGLGRLLRGLNAQFEFTSVAADQLGGLPVWRVSGGWKPAQLARLLPGQKDAIEKGRPADLTRLAGHLPDGVMLFLGQEDCFPFRIDYLRSVPKSSPRCLVGLEFFELNFNGPIDSGQFLFSPGNLDIVDRTGEFVRSLGEGD